MNHSTLADVNSQGKKFNDQERDAELEQKKLWFDADSDSDKENALSPSSKLVKKDLFKKGTEHMTDKKKEFDISPSNSKDLGEDTEVYETLESSPKIDVSPSSRKKKLCFVLESDSKEDYTADAGLTPPSKVGKRIIPRSKEKVKKDLLLQKIKEKRMAATRKILSKAPESKEAGQENPDFLSDSESSEGLPRTCDESFVDDDSIDSQEMQQHEESSEELPSSYDESFIDDGDVDSQDMQQSKEELMLIKKPSLQEAYMCYLEVALTNLLNNDNSTNEIESCIPDPHWYEKCKNLLEDTLSSKKRLVGSTAWGKDFRGMIQSPYALKEEELRHAVDDKCQACRRQRHLTQRFVFRDEDNNGEVKQIFQIGIYCAERGALFHTLHNHLFGELQKTCQIKVKEVSKEIVSAEEIVQLCMNDEEWTEKVFKRFNYLLDEADKWAEDGVKRRRMIAACLEYN